MNILNLILPVFAIIITGWICSYLKIFNKDLGTSLIQFALYIAMPALLFVTIASEPFKNIFNWAFIASFGGGSLLVFLIIFLISHFYIKQPLSRSAISALTGSMTNTGFVALPLLLAIFGSRGILPAAIATVFVAIIMFPLGIFIIEADKFQGEKLMKSFLLSLKQTLTNPMVVSTIAGVIYSSTHLKIPVLLHNYLTILAAALTPCALFAIGLGVNVQALQANAKEVITLTMIKLIILPVVVYGLAYLFHLNPFLTISAVIAAAVPTAKTVYVLAAEYKIASESVAAIISATTIFSVISLLLILLILSQLWPSEFGHTTQIAKF